jgi:peptidyl-prolyl cis-trans isomerase C
MKKFYVAGLALSLLTLPLIASVADTAPAAANNPKVAQVNNKGIFLADLVARKNAMRELQQAPLETVFDPLRDQMVAELLLEQEVSKANLDNDAEVQELARRCTEGAKRQLFLERQVEKMVSDADLMTFFNELMKDFKKQKEVKASHILVQDEAQANQVIKELEKGTDFAALARQHSVDPTSKERGGSLGYFVKDIAKEAMGPEFAESVFVLKAGNFTHKPVKTKFGWHIVKVEEVRTSKPPKFEEAVPQLRMIKSQEALMKFIDGLKKQSQVQLYNMQGQPVADKPATVNVKK